MKLRIEKLEIKEGKSSALFPGHSTNGTFYIGRSDDKGELQLLNDQDLGDIEIGDVLLVNNSIFNFTKTTPVVSIIESTEILVKFETETSIYKIEKIDDPV